jgi:prevent-host-death family protein
MESMEIAEFKSDCSAVLEKVHRTGHPVLITRSGEPVAEIVPASSCEKPKRRLGSLRGSGQILGDIVSPATDEAAWDVLRT